MEHTIKQTAGGGRGLNTMTVSGSEHLGSRGPKGYDGQFWMAAGELEDGWWWLEHEGRRRAGGLVAASGGKKVTGDLGFHE